MTENSVSTILSLLLQYQKQGIPVNENPLYTALLANLDPQQSENALETLVVKYKALRVKEIKEILTRDEMEVRSLLIEIDEIRGGKWDDKLKNEDIIMGEAAEPVSKTSTPPKLQAPAHLPDVELPSQHKPLSSPKATLPTEPPRLAIPDHVEDVKMEEASPLQNDSPVHPKLSPKKHIESPTKPAFSTPSQIDTPSLTEKAFKKNALLFFEKVSNHRFAPIFMSPVKQDEEPDYYNLILQPMCLSQIKARIRDGEIKTLTELHRDLLLVFTNAIMYNDIHSDVYSMAIEMNNFVEAEIRSLAYYSEGGRQKSYTPDSHSMERAPSEDVAISEVASEADDLDARPNKKAPKRKSSARKRK